jgi:hypothetical protein
MGVVHRSALIVSALSGLLLWTALGDCAPVTIDPDIQAAFLYNFMKFVDWPSDVLASNGPLTACVLGSPAVRDALASAVKGRKINDHEIVVSNVTSDGPVRSCHVLYVSAPDEKQTRQLVQALVGSSVFSVSDFERFAALGGIVNFFLQNGRQRFSINQAAAVRARLRISSRMLALATIVKEEQ